MSAYFEQIFPKCQLQQSPLSRVPVIGLEADKAARRLKVKLLAEAIVDQQALADGQEQICQAYGLQQVDLQVQYQLEQLDDKALDYCRSYFAGQYPSFAAAAEAVRMETRPGVLALRGPACWMRRVEQLQQPIQQFLSEHLGLQLQVELEADQDDQAAQAFAEDQQQQLRDAMKQAEAEAAAARQASAKQPEKKRFERRKPEGTVFKPKQSEAAALYGKPVERTVVKMSEIDVDSGKTAVEGLVFYAEEKKLNNRGKTIYTFDMTDGTGSVRCVKVLPDEECAQLIEAVKEGSYVMVQGVANYSTFERDVVISPSAVVEAKRQVRQDTAGEKRVELHLHTCMSAMDGLTDTAAAVQTAARWGHKAIAITDHGVAQSFPDAMHAQQKLRDKGQDIKIIYGVEAYCVNNLVKSQAVSLVIS